MQELHLNDKIYGLWAHTSTVMCKFLHKSLFVLKLNLHLIAKLFLLFWLQLFELQIQSTSCLLDIKVTLGKEWKNPLDYVTFLNSSVTSFFSIISLFMLMFLPACFVLCIVMLGNCWMQVQSPHLIYFQISFFIVYETGKEDFCFFCKGPITLPKEWQHFFI